MASPREPELGALAPLAPNFPRQLGSGEKYPGADVQYNDVVRQIEPNLLLPGRVDMIMDVPYTPRRARFLLRNAVVTITPANHFGSLHLATFPTDRHYIVTNTQILVSATFSGDFANLDDVGYGLGGIPAATNPIAGDAQDLLARIAASNINPAVALSISRSLQAQTTVNTLTTQYIPDGGGFGLYFNWDVTAAQLAADGFVTLNGTVDMEYTDLGPATP